MVKRFHAYEALAANEYAMYRQAAKTTSAQKTTAGNGGLDRTCELIRKKNGAFLSMDPSRVIFNVFFFFLSLNYAPEGWVIFHGAF